MPPKARITRDMILDAAFDLVRAEGHEALNVRTLARRLGCSTQPILYNYPTMDALKDAVYEKADRFHTAHILPRGGEGPDALLELGLNYVRFGHEEKHLFRFLFESDRFGGMDMNALLKGPGVGELVAILAEALGCPAAEAEKVFLTFFAVAHGLGSLLCNNAREYDETECAAMLETVFNGALAALTSKGEEYA